MRMHSWRQSWQCDVAANGTGRRINTACHQMTAIQLSSLIGTITKPLHL